MLSPYLAYLLGLITVLLPLLLFYILSLTFTEVQRSWSSLFCS
jgi:hypothetical protein